MPLPDKRYVTRWLDETWRGREAELVMIPEIARMAKVDPTTVNTWIRRYTHFPEPVMEKKVGPGAARHFVAAEVADWLVANRDALTALDEYAADLDGQIIAMERSLAHLASVRDQIRGALEGARE